MLKICLFLLLTVSLLLGRPASAASAVDVPIPLPLAVAESDLFEIVGRLDAPGFVFHVDRSATNAPVLEAMLEVEEGGRKALARFRPETGDYLIDDAAWLKPLRTPGDYALSFTLLAGSDSDLLTAELAVAAPKAAAGKGSRALAWPLAAAVFLLLFGILLWRKTRPSQGGAA